MVYSSFRICRQVACSFMDRRNPMVFAELFLKNFQNFSGGDFG